MWCSSVRVLYDQKTSIQTIPRIVFRGFVSSSRELLKSLWEEFFRDPAQFEDVRYRKRSWKFPDFRHKLTGNGLWIDGFSNPPWVRAKLQGMDFAHVELKVNCDRDAIIQLLKSCGKKKDISTIRRICADKDWIVQDIVIAATLIRSYAKCGAVKEAQQIFEQLAVRDAVCWNALIAGYTDQGLPEEALSVFREMERDRVMPDQVTFICTLKACALVGAIEVVKEIHDRVRNQGFLNQDIVLGSILVHAYVKCGAVKKAQELFDGLSERNVVSWNGLIAGYVDQGFGKEALKCFREMEEHNVTPDSVTYICTLKACAIARDLEVVEIIHARLKDQAGLLDKDIVLGSSLVHAYAKCGAVKDAMEVFNKLTDPDVVSWNALIAGYADQGFGKEAFTCFREMQRYKVTPNAVTYMCTLKACAILRTVDIVKEIHTKVRDQALLNGDIMLGNTLLDAYAKCGALKEAQEVFDELLERDVVSWNALIAGFVEQGFGEGALTCFRNMEKEKVVPDSVTYICTLKACALVGAREIVDEMHVRLIDKSLLNNDIVLGSALVDAYAKCGAVKEARGVFDKLVKRDAVLWNALITGYVDQGFGEEALACFREMEGDKVKPDSVTYICTLKACAMVGVIQIVEEINDRVRHEDLLSKDIALGSMLVDAYAKCGELSKAQEAFFKMAMPDVVSWSAVIDGYAKAGRVNEMLNLLNRLMVTGTKPDAVMYTVLLNGCSHGALLDEGQRLFDTIVTFGIAPTPEHYACMVDLFGRAGCFDEAKCFVLDHASPLLAFLGACQKWENVDHGRWAFEKLLKLDRMCGSAYVCMSNIYAAAGMMKEADEIEFLRVKEKNSENAHNFALGNKSQSHNMMYSKLCDKLTTGRFPDLHLVSRLISDHEKTTLYSQKIAIACALINTS